MRYIDITILSILVLLAFSAGCADKSRWAGARARPTTRFRM
jgi:hypothetical protein